MLPEIYGEVVKEKQAKAESREDRNVNALSCIRDVLISGANFGNGETGEYCCQE